MLLCRCSLFVLGYFSSSPPTAAHEKKVQPSCMIIMVNKNKTRRPKLKLPSQLPHSIGNFLLRLFLILYGLFSASSIVHRYLTFVRTVLLSFILVKIHIVLSTWLCPNLTLPKRFTKICIHVISLLKGKPCSTEDKH